MTGAEIATVAVRELNTIKGARLVKPSYKGNWTHLVIDLMPGLDAAAAEALANRAKYLGLDRFQSIPSTPQGPAEIVIVRSRKACVRFVAQFVIATDEKICRLDLFGCRRAGT